MSLATNQQRVGVALDQLFPTATRTGIGGVSATSCVSDWRQVQPGDVFVALPEGCGLEPSDDGHQHAKRAVSCGAVAVICERPVPVFDVPTYLVLDSREAFGELCQALMEHPTHSMPTIGVTGTQGKTTVIALIDAIFAAAGRECGVMSSLGCYDGMSHSQGISDAPSAPTVASRLANMVAASCSHGLLEVSSRSLSQRTLTGVQLDAVCVTNITQAHLDLHNTVQNYRDTKRRILQLLSPEGVVVLNADDPECVKWIEYAPGPVLTYGFGPQAEIRAQEVESHCNEQVFMLIAGSESVAVRTSVVGKHHISNCLAAATLALTYGIDLTTIAKGLQAVDKIPGRMEKVDCGQGFPVYVDAAETADAMRAALRTARQYCQGRLICVLGERTSLSESEEFLLNSVVESMADVTITTRVPTDGTGQTGGVVEIAPNRNTAIAWAVSIADPGDVVVIAGAQTSPTRTFGAAQEDDVEITRQLLYARNSYPLKVAA